VAPDKSGRDDPGSDVYVEEYLYDLVQDPHEKYNLVRHPFFAGLRAELAARLVQRMVEAGEAAPEIRPAS